MYITLQKMYSPIYTNTYLFSYGYGFTKTASGMDVFQMLRKFIFKSTTGQLLRTFCHWNMNTLISEN